MGLSGPVAFERLSRLHLNTHERLVLFLLPLLAEYAALRPEVQVELQERVSQVEAPWPSSIHWTNTGSA